MNMNLMVKFYDVEHGCCTHVITPNNKHLLYDIGSKANSSICAHLKKKYFSGGGRPDMLAITHPHIDHISDLCNMYYYNIKPGCLWRDKRAFPLKILPSDGEAQIVLKKCANKMNDEYSSAIGDDSDPESYICNGGVTICRFTPTLVPSEYDDVNNFSCVSVLVYNSFKIVLTGDNPANKLLEMLKASDYFKQAISNATILLAPHHGRDGEFCSEFVSTVYPKLTVFSDKPIVHETQTHSAQRYANATRGVTWNGQNRKVFTTRSDGTITFTFNSDGNWSIDTSTTEY
jgi:competence protein ComEC